MLRLKRNGPHSAGHHELAARLVKAVIGDFYADTDSPGV